MAPQPLRRRVSFREPPAAVAGAESGSAGAVAPGHLKRRRKPVRRVWADYELLPRRTEASLTAELAQFEGDKRLVGPTTAEAAARLHAVLQHGGAWVCGAAAFDREGWRKNTHVAFEVQPVREWRETQPAAALAKLYLGLRDGGDDNRLSTSQDGRAARVLRSSLLSQAEGDAAVRAAAQAAQRQALKAAAAAAKAAEAAELAAAKAAAEAAERRWKPLAGRKTMPTPIARRVACTLELLGDVCAEEIARDQHQQILGTTPDLVSSPGQGVTALAQLERSLREGHGLDGSETGDYAWLTEVEIAQVMATAEREQSARVGRMIALELLTRQRPARPATQHGFGVQFTVAPRAIDGCEPAPSEAISRMRRRLEAAHAVAEAGISPAAAAAAAAAGATVTIAGAHALHPGQLVPPVPDLTVVKFSVLPALPDHTTRVSVALDPPTTTAEKRPSSADFARLQTHMAKKFSMRPPEEPSVEVALENLRLRTASPSGCVLAGAQAAPLVLEESSGEDAGDRPAGGKAAVCLPTSSRVQAGFDPEAFLSDSASDAGTDTAAAAAAEDGSEEWWRLRRRPREPITRVRFSVAPLPAGSAPQPLSINVALSLLQMKLAGKEKGGTVAGALVAPAGVRADGSGRQREREPATADAGHYFGLATDAGSELELTQRIEAATFGEFMATAGPAIDRDARGDNDDEVLQPAPELDTPLPPAAPVIQPTSSRVQTGFDPEAFLSDSSSEHSDAEGGSAVAVPCQPVSSRVQTGFDPQAFLSDSSSDGSPADSGMATAAPESTAVRPELRFPRPRERGHRDEDALQRAIVAQNQQLIENERAAMAERLRGVRAGDALWFESADIMLSGGPDGYRDVLKTIRNGTARYCRACFESRNMPARETVGSSGNGNGDGTANITPWVFKGVMCQARHSKVFTSRDIPPETVDTLLAAEEVDHYLTEQYKSHLLRMQYVEMLEDRRRATAATVLARYLRGWLVRRHQAAALHLGRTVQNAFRGRRARQEITAMRRAIPKLQANCRRLLVRWAQRNIDNSPKAVQVQALWRGHMARQRLRQRCGNVVAWPMASIPAVIRWLQYPKPPETVTEEHRAARGIILCLSHDHLPKAAKLRRGSTEVEAHHFHRGKSKGDLLLKIGRHGGFQLSAHQRVVSAQSTVLGATIRSRREQLEKLKHAMTPGQQPTGVRQLPISLVNEEPRDMYQLLSYMYGLPVHLDVLGTLRLYNLADRYEVTRAMEQSWQLLQNWATQRELACTIHAAAQEIGCKRATELCWKYIMRLLSSLVSDPQSDIEALSKEALLALVQNADLALHGEEIMLRLVLRWTAVNVQERGSFLSANLLSIQWALLSHELLQACVSDEIKMCRMLQLDVFAPWHGGEGSLSSLVVWLRQSNVIVRAVDRSFRTEEFASAIDLAQEFTKVVTTGSTMGLTAATAPRDYIAQRNLVAEQEALEDFLQQRPTEAGVVWYLVAHRWMVTWMDHVNHWQSCVQPGQIDNGILIIKVNGQTDNQPLDFSSSPLGRVTRPHMTEGVDFDVVSESVWRRLAAWYGGGPELPRWSTHDRMRGFEIEIYPIQLQVALQIHGATAQTGGSYPRHLRSLEISRTALFAHLKEAACALHALVPRTDVDEISCWEWSRSVHHVRWSRLLPKAQREQIEAHTIGESGIVAGDTICLTLSPEARHRRRCSVGLEVTEGTDCPVSPPKSPSLFGGEPSAGEAAASRRAKPPPPPRPLDSDLLSSLSASNTTINLNVLSDDSEDESENGDKVDATDAAQSSLAAVQRDEARIGPASKNRLTVIEMLTLVQQELGLPQAQSSGVPNVAESICEARSAVGLPLAGAGAPSTLRAQLEQLRVELGIRSWELPTADSTAATPNPSRHGQQASGADGARSGCCDKLETMVEDLSRKTDRVMDVVTGLGQREDVQQMVRAFAILEGRAASHETTGAEYYRRKHGRDFEVPKEESRSALFVRMLPPPRSTKVVAVIDGDDSGSDRPDHASSAAPVVSPTSTRVAEAFDPAAFIGDLSDDSTTTADGDIHQQQQQQQQQEEEEEEEEEEEKRDIEPACPSISSRVQTVFDPDAFISDSGSEQDADPEEEHVVPSEAAPVCEPTSSRVSSVFDPEAFVDDDGSSLDGGEAQQQQQQQQQQQPPAETCQPLSSCVQTSFEPAAFISSDDDDDSESVLTAADILYPTWKSTLAEWDSVYPYPYLPPPPPPPAPVCEPVSTRVATGFDPDAFINDTASDDSVASVDAPPPPPLPRLPPPQLPTPPPPPTTAPPHGGSHALSPLIAKALELMRQAVMLDRAAHINTVQAQGTNNETHMVRAKVALEAVQRALGACLATAGHHCPAAVRQALLQKRNEVLRRLLRYKHTQVPPPPPSAPPESVIQRRQQYIDANSQAATAVPTVHPAVPAPVIQPTSSRVQTGFDPEAFLSDSSSEHSDTVGGTAAAVACKPVSSRVQTGFDPEAFLSSDSSSERGGTEEGTAVAVAVAYQSVSSRVQTGFDSDAFVSSDSSSEQDGPPAPTGPAYGPLPTARRVGGAFDPSAFVCSSSSGSGSSSGDGEVKPLPLPEPPPLPAADQRQRDRHPAAAVLRKVTPPPPPTAPPSARQRLRRRPPPPPHPPNGGSKPLSWHDALAATHRQRAELRGATAILNPAMYGPAGLQAAEDDGEPLVLGFAKGGIVSWVTHDGRTWGEDSGLPSSDDDDELE